MMPQKKIILTVLSLIILVGFLRICFVKEPTKYIVVKNAFFNRSNIYQPNATLLISDTKEIIENEQLFLGKKAYNHACGYHYAIQFWTDSEKVIGDIPFNQECEEFVENNDKAQLKIQTYVAQLETNPTHYIYNLQIPVNIEPKDLLKSFDNSGLHLFFYGRKI